MDKVSKKSLKSSKRKEKDLSKKIRNLTKSGKLEEELEVFKTNDDNVILNENQIVDSVEEMKGNDLVEETKIIEMSTEVEKDDAEKYSAMILNLPHDATKEELSNFLSKRGIPVDAIRIDNAKYAVIESDDIDTINKIQTLIKTKPLLNCESMAASKLVGNAQRLATLCQRNTILNKSIIIVKNISINTQIEDVLALIPEGIVVKRHSDSKIRNRKVKSQMLSIEFESQNKTDEVLEKLNNAVLDDHQLVAEFKHKLVDDSDLETRSLTLLLKDLPSITTYQMIKNFGLPSTKIELVKKSAKILCFMTFGTVKDASEAYEILANKELDGTKISVKFVEVKTEKPEEPVDNLKLHITNLPYSCTKEDIEKEFDMADSVKFPLNVSGKSKGCCYLAFSSAELAALGMEAFKDKLICGRKIRCTYAKKSKIPYVHEEKKEKKAAKPEGNVLTIFNLPMEVKLEDIKSKFHNVKFINIVKQGAIFKGIAEVHFTNAKSAQAALEAPKFEISGREIRKELKGGKWRDGTVKKTRTKNPKKTEKKTSKVNQEMEVDE